MSFYLPDFGFQPAFAARRPVPLQKKRAGRLAATALLGGLLLVLAGCASSRPPTGAEEPPAKAEKAEVAQEEEQRLVGTGYGVQERDEVTGAVSEVPVEALREGRAANHLSDLLQGSAAGVRVSKGPGGGVTVRIRGTKSFHGSNAPLYVVDGMTVEAGPDGTLPWLNPADVASISILKDASASIYGSRGANGVILITTKR